MELYLPRLSMTLFVCYFVHPCKVKLFGFSLLLRVLVFICLPFAFTKKSDCDKVKFVLSM